VNHAGNETETVKRRTAGSLSYDRGTLLLTGLDQTTVSSIFGDGLWTWDSRVSAWRCEAVHYASVRTVLQAHPRPEIVDEVLPPPRVGWKQVTLPELRPEQQRALDAWQAAQGRGVVVMPTGTGKTEVALAAMAEARVSTLVVAPVRDLMYQWHRRILRAFDYDAGIVGDNTFNQRTVTVTTYDSAYIHVAFERGRARPDRLTRRTHAHYLGYAERMLSLYRAGEGKRRRDLHRSVEGLFAEEPDCDPRRIHSFCKLLDDESEYETDRTGRAAKLRLRVFSAAAPYHPLVREPDRLFERKEAEVKALLARDIGRPWEEIETELYADVLGWQRLRSFSGSSDRTALLARYNVAQVQACLYRAERLVITATSDFKTILRQAKLAHLLHEIERCGPSSYRIRLTGPASVLRETRRYGVNMARFLPSLLACRGWNLEASIRTPWGQSAKLVLSEKDQLRSHLEEPAAFDSLLEERFAERFGAERQGWHLLREAAVLHQGQSVFVPDFTFRHQDGTEVLFEIVGFWTPEYLEQKRATLRRFRQHTILVAVPARSLRESAAVPEDFLIYKTVIKPAVVLEALERVRSRRDAPSADSPEHPP
jgi:hypothetical protein